MRCSASLNRNNAPWKLLRNAASRGRDNFLRNTTEPSAAAPCSWTLRFAKSIPTMLTFSMVALSLYDSLSCYHSGTLRCCRLGHPPHHLCIIRSPSQPVVTISLPRHRHLEPVLVQDFLIVMRVILRPEICVMDAAFRLRSERDSNVQRPDSQITLPAVTDPPSRSNAGNLDPGSRPDTTSLGASRYS